MTVNKKTIRQTILTVLRITGQILCCLLVLVSFIALYSAQWYGDVYGDLGFDSVLFTLFANLNGVESDLILSWCGQVLPASLFLSALTIFILMFQSRKQIVIKLLNKIKLRLFPLSRPLSALICLILCACLLISAARVAKLDEYIANLSTLSRVFEEEFKDPETTTISFPKEKRNLIYIFLESMETSYLSNEQGGMLEASAIPELYQLAQENINFSHNEDVGGFSAISGATWTIGAMVAQTAGIPLKTPPGVDGNGYGSDGNFLPGVTTLTDILHENGYYQTLMVGSDASFGGRKQYFEQHNIDYIYDLFTARADGIIPKNYYVWWGFEDKYLFQYARQELTELAEKDQPFAFTMLTVDTHHIGGYPCEYCDSTYDEQYENVFACSSRQVAAFVEWIQQQDFYEDTTIIIAGDHPSMDNGYFQRVQPENYTRHVYNCFINPAVTPVSTQNRWFCAYDMFPTTLGALGCTIDGDRLGLGTNLFSTTPTLLESTSGAIAAEFGKTSQYYTDKFFFK